MFLSKQKDKWKRYKTFFVATCLTKWTTKISRMLIILNALLYQSLSFNKSQLIYNFISYLSIFLENLQIEMLWRYLLTFTWIIYTVSVLFNIAKFIQPETDNISIHFQLSVLLDFATIFHKSEIEDVDTTETDELIRDIELANQKMMNLIRMKTIVTKLMTAITIN